MVMQKEQIVPMEDTIAALIAELVQPLLSTKMVRDPPISQQEKVAKQMHAIVLLFNYYHRSKCPNLEFLTFESFCKMATISNEPLLGYLQKTALCSENLSLVEETIMRACNVSMALFDNGQGSIETWPIVKVAVFLADDKKEKCFLEKDTLVAGVFSLVEIDIEGQKDDALEKFALSKIESRTGISQASLRIRHRSHTYSLSTEKSRVIVFVVECSKLPAKDKGFSEVPIKDVLNNLEGPVVTSDSKTLTPVVGFFLLLPYARIISDWLSKRTSEPEKELEKRSEKQANSNNKSSMKTDNMRAQVKKEPSNISLNGKDMNGNNNPDKQRGLAAPIAVSSNNYSGIHTASFVGPSSNYSPKNVPSVGKFSSKPVRSGEEDGNKRGDNGVLRDVKQETANTSKELVQVNSKLCTPTKRPVVEPSVRQDIAPFVMKDFPSCLHLLNKIRGDLCEDQRKLEDKIAQCEMDIQTIISEGRMTSEVEKIVKRWEYAILCEGQLDFSIACPNANKKKKFKLRSACQQLDDNCRDNNLPLPRYHVHPISDDLYMATAQLKSRDIDCMAESDSKKNPHDAREHAAWCLMQKLSEMEEN